MVEAKQEQTGGTGASHSGAVKQGVPGSNLLFVVNAPGSLRQVTSSQPEPLLCDKDDNKVIYAEHLGAMVKVLGSIHRTSSLRLLHGRR